MLNKDRLKNYSYYHKIISTKKKKLHKKKNYPSSDVENDLHEISCFVLRDIKPFAGKMIYY